LTSNNDNDKYVSNNSKCGIMKKFAKTMNDQYSVKLEYDEYNKRTENTSTSLRKAPPITYYDCKLYFDWS